MTGPVPPQVSVVVPVYRNAETLHELHRRLCLVLETQGLPFEILFVNDACPAGSQVVLDELVRQDERVAVLLLDRNVGQQSAVMAGLQIARGDWVVVMDADLQDPPEEIPGLLAKGKDGFAAVFAGRRGAYESTFRLITSRVFKTLIHFLSGVPSDAGLFVAMNKPMVDRLLAIGGRRPHLVPMIGCAGLPVASIPVERSPRPFGRSAYGFWGRVGSAWRGISWAISWKWSSRRGESRARWVEPPVKVYLGARFADRGGGVDR